MSCPGNKWTIAGGACEARSRSEEEAMPGHRRRRATQRWPATPTRPKGCGGTAGISLLLLLADGVASTRRRASICPPSRSQQWTIYFLDRTLESFECRVSNVECCRPQAQNVRSGSPSARDLLTVQNPQTRRKRRCGASRLPFSILVTSSSRTLDAIRRSRASVRKVSMLPQISRCLPERWKQMPVRSTCMA